MAQRSPTSPVARVDAQNNVFNTALCPVETVVVYQDRAEVCRSLKTRVERGENEIVVTELSRAIHKDSIRVETRGAVASISEVTYRVRQVTAEDEVSVRSKQDELGRELDRLTLQSDTLSSRRKRLNKQKDVLDSYAQNAVKAPVNNSDIEEFLDIYDKRATRLDDALHTLVPDCNRLEEKIGSVRRQLTELKNSTSTKEIREVSIVVECEEAGEVELYVTYIVTSARWTPAYHVRVSRNDNKLQLAYYGMVSQSTGESWESTKLYLSTAQPTQHGTCPVLPPHTLTLKASQSSDFQRRRSSSLYSSLRAHRPHSSIHTDRPTDSPARLTKCPHLSEMKTESCDRHSNGYQSGSLEASFCEGEELGGQGEGLGALEAELNRKEAELIPTAHQTSVAMYEISGRSSVSSDSSNHKLTIAQLELSPSWHYSCVPSLSSGVYMTARVVNSSPYTLLPGPVSVFLDHNYISKCTINGVQPHGHFDCSLGVDPLVKVTYQPVSIHRHTPGLLSKTASTKYRQVSCVQNSRRDDISVTLTDTLPQAKHDKVKVTLTEPVIKSSDRSVRLNKNNNVEFELTVEGGEGREVVVRYTVEHPATDTVHTATPHHSPT